MARSCTCHLPRPALPSFPAGSTARSGTTDLGGSRTHSPQLPPNGAGPGAVGAAMQKPLVAEMREGGLWWGHSDLGPQWIEEEALQFVGG